MPEPVLDVAEPVLDTDDSFLDAAKLVLDTSEPVLDEDAAVFLDVAEARGTEVVSLVPAFLDDAAVPDAAERWLAKELPDTLPDLETAADEALELAFAPLGVGMDTPGMLFPRCP